MDKRSTRPAGFLTGILVGLMPLSGQAESQQSFYDFAPVIRVEPIREPVSVPTDREVCPDDRVRLWPETAGRIDSRKPGLSLGALIRRDTRTRHSRLHQSGDCGTETGLKETEIVVAYRVWYRYGGETFVRLLPRDPGKQVKVRVDLDPLKR